MLQKNKLSSLSNKIYASILASCLIANPLFATGDNYALNAVVYPVMSPKFTSSFGHRNHPVLKAKKHHQGVDLAAPVGAPIRAIQEGVVVFADPYSAYGNLIVIKHNNGLTSHYGHCAKIEAKIGSKVKAGEIIGTVGKTGRVTGAHLHFEMRDNGKALDPEQYLPALRNPAEG